MFQFGGPGAPEGGASPGGFVFAPPAEWDVLFSPSSCSVCCVPFSASARHVCTACRAFALCAVCKRAEPRVHCFRQPLTCVWPLALPWGVVERRAEDKQCHLLTAPDEVFLSICFRLSLQDVARLLSTCRKLWDLRSWDLLWRGLARRECPLWVPWMDVLPRSDLSFAARFRETLRFKRSPGPSSHDLLAHSHGLGPHGALTAMQGIVTLAEDDSSPQNVVLARGCAFVLGRGGRLVRGRDETVSLPGWRANFGSKLTPSGGLAALPRLGDTRQLLELRGIFLPLAGSTAAAPKLLGASVVATDGSTVYVVGPKLDVRRLYTSRPTSSMRSLLVPIGSAKLAFVRDSVRPARDDPVLASPDHRVWEKVHARFPAFAEGLRGAQWNLLPTLVEMTTRAAAASAHQTVHAIAHAAGLSPEQFIAEMISCKAVVTIEYLQKVWKAIPAALPERQLAPKFAAAQSMELELVVFDLGQPSDPAPLKRRIPLCRRSLAAWAGLPPAEALHHWVGMATPNLAAHGTLVAVPTACASGAASPVWVVLIVDAALGVVARSSPFAPPLNEPLVHCGLSAEAPAAAEGFVWVAVFARSVVCVRFAPLGQAAAPRPIVAIPADLQGEQAICCAAVDAGSGIVVVAIERRGQEDAEQPLPARLLLLDARSGHWVGTPLPLVLAAPHEQPPAPELRFYLRRVGCVWAVDSLRLCDGYVFVTGSQNRTLCLAFVSLDATRGTMEVARLQGLLGAVRENEPLVRAHFLWDTANVERTATLLRGRLLGCVGSGPPLGFRQPGFGELLQHGMPDDMVGMLQGAMAGFLGANGGGGEDDDEDDDGRRNSSDDDDVDENEHDDEEEDEDGDSEYFFCENCQEHHRC